jgi:hypothetical protein
MRVTYDLIQLREPAQVLQQGDRAMRQRVELFVAQSDHGIEAYGATCRDVTGKQRNRGNDRSGGREGSWIQWFHTVKDGLH